MLEDNDEYIQKKIAAIDGLDGMTVNERLHISGLMNEFDTALLNDKARAQQILTLLNVDELSINTIIGDTDENR
ncbi:hypothetical protein [Pedobacter frigoris]|uniref:hypothetical protein n=1 Tax=Pedobacter frigoris TaxID=2571272 RepID=UPI002930BE96|nr:hypothetical protein [Pedobacter frigoris]